MGCSSTIVGCDDISFSPRSDQPIVGRRTSVSARPYHWLGPREPALSRNGTSSGDWALRPLLFRDYVRFRTRVFQCSSSVPGPWVMDERFDRIRSGSRLQREVFLTRSYLDPSSNTNGASPVCPGSISLRMPDRMPFGAVTVGESGAEPIQTSFENDRNLWISTASF